MDGPDNAQPELEVDGNQLTINPDMEGMYGFRVTVTDGLGGEARLSFPLHVSEGEAISRNRTIEAGPIWSDVMSLDVCPGVCEDAGGRWTRHWWTTIPGQMSVCQCAFEVCE